MPWKFGAATDIGGRSEQQDRLAILHSQDGLRHLIVVADGMGGLQNGAQAAQTLVDVAADRFSQYHGDAPHAFLQGICQAAHDAINHRYSTAAPVPGTTALLLYLDKQKAFWAHVGDSRLYHFRKGRLLTHTTDHSLLQLMLDKGLVEAGSADAAAMQNQLYRRLGGEQMPEPDFNASEVKNGDLFLLCSDGFWQAVQPNEMVAALKQYSPDRDGPQYLVNLALQRSGGGCDNISLAVSQWSGSAAPGCWQCFANVLRKLSRAAK